jgi:methionine-rich copper-binding protein CopC
MGKLGPVYYAEGFVYKMRAFSLSFLQTKTRLMWQKITTCRNDKPTKKRRHSGFKINGLRIPIYCLCFVLVISQAGKASSYTPVGIESKSELNVSTSKINRYGTELYQPHHQLSGSVEPKILLAHAIIVKTSPPQGGVASGDIGKVDVWYDAGIRDSLAALAVISSSGERIDKRDAAIDSADPAHVSVTVNPMTPGKYTVRYRALSADGHMVSGAWEFDVQP